MTESVNRYTQTAVESYIYGVQTRFYDRAEPYRLLFPLGIAGAAIGIGIWIPYFFWPHAFPYPGQGHAVIQIQGFLLCFIFGFLTTMLPKVLGVAPLGPLSFALFPVLLAGIIGASLADAPILAQVLHLLVLLNFLAFAARRFPLRKSAPPPSFLFIAAAMLVDLTGTVVKLGALSGVLSGQGMRAGSLLQYQAFPLLLILGVGSFLLPKLLADGPIDPKALRGQPGAGMAAPLILCLLFLASFAVEILGDVNGFGQGRLQLAYAVRAAVWIWFLVARIRIHAAKAKLPPFLNGARISLISVAVGLLMPVLLPRYLLAWEHLIFISGFLYLTLSIASRVLTAHSGRLDILAMHGWQVRLYGLLLVLAMLTRIAADIWTRGHWMHLAVAAALALAALIIWGRIFLPLSRILPAR